MLKQLASVLAIVAALPASALTTGDIGFTAFNADEDGLSFVVLADIAADTTIYFADNEWDGSVFNMGESHSQWMSGANPIAAGTVVRLADFDKAAPIASVGVLSRVSVSGSSNWGLAASNETVYAYLGSDATTPTTFLTAVTNGDFAANGPLTNTGLIEGVNAIRLNALATSASPDYAEYTGARGGLATFAAYRPLLADPANWTVDTTNGAYATVIPDTTAFSITAVPEPETYALMLAGLAAIGLMAGRRQA